MSEHNHKRNRRAKSGHTIPIAFLSESDASADEVIQFEGRPAPHVISPETAGRLRIRIRWLS